MDSSNDFSPLDTQELECSINFCEKSIKIFISVLRGSVLTFVTFPLSWHVCLLTTHFYNVVV